MHIDAFVILITRVQNSAYRCLRHINKTSLKQWKLMSSSYKWRWNKSSAYWCLCHIYDAGTKAMRIDDFVIFSKKSAEDNKIIHPYLRHCKKEAENLHIFSVCFCTWWGLPPWVNEWVSETVSSGAVLYTLQASSVKMLICL